MIRAMFCVYNTLFSKQSKTYTSRKNYLFLYYYDIVRVLEYKVNSHSVGFNGFIQKIRGFACIIIQYSASSFINILIVFNDPGCTMLYWHAIVFSHMKSFYYTLLLKTLILLHSWYLDLDFICICFYIRKLRLLFILSLSFTLNNKHVQLFFILVIFCLPVCSMSIVIRVNLFFQIKPINPKSTVPLHSGDLT